MKIKMRGVWASALSLILLAIVSIAAPANAQSPGKLAAEKMAGHWQLVSVTANGGEPYGPHPQGSMFVDTEGHYSIIVLGAGIAADFTAFGTYTFNAADDSVTLHIDGSSLANATGRDMKRIISFTNNQLVAVSPPSDDPTGAIKMTWQR